MIGAVAFAVAGCNELLGLEHGVHGASPDATLPTPAPRASCSDLGRVFARWQGNEFATCGSMSFRTLTPLGNGSILALSTTGGYYDLWQLRPDGSFGSQPVAGQVNPSLGDNRLLTALTPERLLVFNQKSGQTVVFGLNPTARGLAHAVSQKLTEQAWPLVLGGNGVAALDSSHVLVWQPGDGRYGVVRYRENDRLSPFERFNDLGGDAGFRRARRLIVLARNRLLSWDPRTGDYEIRSYALDRLPGDIFDLAPLAGGSFSQLDRRHELLVLAEDRIGIWDRSAGTIEVRQFDPLADDPLGGAVLNTTQDDRFRSPLPSADTPTRSKIRRLVILFRYGRSFDSYFGRYCKAPPGSEPACEHGPECCEATPDLVDGQPCTALDPANDSYVPDGSVECVLEKIEAWAANSLSDPPACGDARDFTCAGTGQAAGPVATYHELARQGAIADRYFASSAAWELDNIIYFGLTGYAPAIEGQDVPVISTLLAYAGISYSLYLPSIAYAFGQQAPLYYDGSWAHYRQLDELAYDIENELLPAVSVLIPDDVRSEAPGTPGSLSNGIESANATVRSILDSPRYGAETLVIIAHLTSGGAYDHVRPPPIPPPAPPNGAAPAATHYGPRVPFLAVGPFVRRNHVSHAELEHSSLTAFIEWNWLDGKTGGLGGRDGFVNNLGSLLDPAATGVAVP